MSGLAERSFPARLAEGYRAFIGDRFARLAERATGQLLVRDPATGAFERIGDLPPPRRRRSAASETASLRGAKGG